MNYVRVKAYAKINLTLDVLGRKDGYHEIDSLVTSVDIADVIAVQKRKKDKLASVTCHGMGSENIPFGDNNAVRAAERFIEKYDTCGADITVWKNIPMGAGLGGSSADAAGTLNALARLFGIDDFDGIKEIADEVGSDSGYMLSGGYARLTGRGDEVGLLDNRLKLDIGLLVPKTGVSTAECYRLSDELNSGICGTQSALEAIEAGNKVALGKALSNGLFAPACALNHEIREAYDELKSFSPLGVNMTGSGSAVYALFENDQFLNYAKSRYRGRCRFITTKTITVKREDK